MTNNEGPVIIDGNFEPVEENKPNTTPQYNDGTMEAAFVKAGFPPLPEQQTTPAVANQPVAESQPVQNVSTPTPEVTTGKTQYVNQEVEASATNAAYKKAVEDAEKRQAEKKPVSTPATPKPTPTMTNTPPVSTPTNIPVTPKTENTTISKPTNVEKQPKVKKSEPKKTDTPVEIEGAYKSIPEVDALKTNLGEIKGQLDEKNRKMVEVLIAALGNADVQKAMQTAIEEKNAADRFKQYTDKKGNLVDIPLPIKEEMDLTFDKRYAVANVFKAEEYATMENNHYNRKFEERVKELRERGETEEYIKGYMASAKYEIKDKAQRHVKTRVTSDIRSRVIERILKDPIKYKDFIDPTNPSKVIKSIQDDDLIGEILGQKVYPGWMKGEADARKNRIEVIPTIPEIIEPPKPEKTKNRRWGLIGGVIGFTAAVAGGASVGVPVTIGATVLSIGAAVAEKYAPKRIEKLTERLANAKTPEERANLEKRLKVWNFVNKHAHNTMKFFGGMATGAGIGTAISKFFMGGKGLVEVVGNRIEAGQATIGQGVNEGAQYNQTGSSSGEGAPVNSNAPSEGAANIDSGVSAGAETGNLGNNTIQAETNIGIDTNNGILIKSGRVNLPGSAWNGNLGTQPPGGLANGTLNPSNFTGGATNMGAFNLESALQSNGVTESLLRNNLQTPEIHRLLNIFVSNPSTDLSTALQSLNSEGAKTILEAISN